MKRFYTSLLIISAFMLNGCIGEDMDSCPQITDNNLNLLFAYTENGTDLFSERMHNVDVFVFDRDGYFVRQQALDQASLSSFAGTALSLRPGTYRIVCWANTLGHTLFDGLDSNSLFEEAYIANNAVQTNNAATNGDPLYYAPQTGRDKSLPMFIVTVPEQGEKTEIIPFTCAHIVLEVYIKGFEDPFAAGEALAPIVELTGVAARYNFDMQTFGSAISYRDNSSYQMVEGENLACISFYTPLFDEDTPIEVLIQKSSSGSTVTGVSLKDFIRDNHISIDGKTRQVIPMLIEYKGSSVEITLPEWGHNPVKPEV